MRLSRQSFLQDLESKKGEGYEYMRDWYNEILFDSIYVWDNAIVINFEGNEYVDSQFRDKITYLIQKINNVSEDVQFNMYELGY